MDQTISVGAAMWETALRRWEVVMSLRYCFQSFHSRPVRAVIFFQHVKAEVGCARPCVEAVVLALYVVVGADSLAVNTPVLWHEGGQPLSLNIVNHWLQLLCGGAGYPVECRSDMLLRQIRQGEK